MVVVSMVNVSMVGVSVVCVWSGCTGGYPWQYALYSCVCRRSDLSNCDCHCDSGEV